MPAVVNLVTQMLYQLAAELIKDGLSLDGTTDFIEYDVFGFLLPRWIQVA